MMNIVLLDAQTLGDGFSKTIAKLGNFKSYEITKTDEVIERSRDADIILTNKVVLNKEILEKLPKLKLICVTATGTNNIDLEYAKKLNIEVKNVANYSTQSVAQHTLMLALNLLGKQNYYDDFVKSGKWANSEIFTHINGSFELYDLENKNWGIIGFGNIGQKVAILAKAFGANVKYALTDRWGVESGVAYTLLKSELTSGGAQDYYAAEQTIHYLGIPLKVHFTVWQNDHFRAYANAGGMMEIPLSGKTETDYITNGQLSDSRTEDVDVDRLQWSVSGAVGFQYNFIENLGIYVEPGIGYYFDDGSDVLTVYKDKPLNFSLQVGVRLELK